MAVHGKGMQEGEFVQERLVERSRRLRKNLLWEGWGGEQKKDERAGYCGEKREGSRRSWKKRRGEVFDFWHIGELWVGV